MTLNKRGILFVSTFFVALLLTGCGSNTQKTSKAEVQGIVKVANDYKPKKATKKTVQKTSSSPVATKQATNSTGNTSSNNPQTTQSSNTSQKVLGVPYISQGSTMLCEGSSLLEALHYKGVTNQGIYQFVNSMPISPNNNPYNGYSGEWRHNVNGTYQGMMAGPVVQWAAKVGGRASQISGAAAIKNSINNNNPVVAWIVYGFSAPQFKQMPWGRAVWNGHVICVDGYRPGGYHIVDPNAGSYWISSGTFESSNGVTGMAVSVG